jgi:hypothetical protein
VTCDGCGRIVCFEIREGKGDLRARLHALGRYARSQPLGVMPVQVLDRESDRQDIANPEIKPLEQTLQATKTQLNRLYKQHAKSKPSTNKDGTPHANSKQQGIAEDIGAREAELARLRHDRAKLPERVDVAGLAHYRSFQAIDNDGKNLFDFHDRRGLECTPPAHRPARGQHAKDSDRVDLLYAILHYHGWIHSDGQWVVVRLEPLQQSARRSDQERLCRKLSGLGAKIPGGKWPRIEVGDSSL